MTLKIQNSVLNSTVVYTVLSMEMEHDRKTSFVDWIWNCRLDENLYNLNYSTAGTELGRNPVSEHHIQPEYGDEQADAGRDCRTRLARPNSQARTRTEKYPFSLFS